MDCSSPGCSLLHYLWEFPQIHVHWVGDAIQPSHPLSPPSLPAPNLSQHRGLFQWVSSLHQMGKVLELHFQHQSFQWIFRVISFRMDSLDLLAVQGTLKSLLQHHSSKTTILRCLAFLTLAFQLSYLYMITGKLIALTVWTFVGKVISLLFNMLSRFVIAYLPRSNCILISWQQEPFIEILEPPKIKSVTVFLSICHEVMGPDTMIFIFWMLSFKSLFHSLLSPSSRGCLVPLCFLP